MRPLLLRSLVLLALPILPAACQRYKPRPLDLAEHHRALLARDPAGPEVADYARQLGVETDAARPRYDPADGLSLAEAEVVALVFNPSLRLARARAKVPLAGAAEAGRWEDPELGVDV